VNVATLGTAKPAPADAGLNPENKVTQMGINS